jgi:hypothetical protein
VQEKILESPSILSLDLVSFVNPTQVAQETSHKESDTPIKGARTTKEGATTKKGKKPKRKPYGEETIGVDEEGMYSDTDSLIALRDSSYDTDLTASSDSDPEYDPEDEIVDDDGDDITPFTYDVGRVFIDVKQ